ncbi:MAG TPA: Rnase Y domain-containing protein, partial [Brumimicrobium sp.]|nr:Rnase Y domain-containing protein [Brumimicrobium sp.]
MEIIIGVGIGLVIGGVLTFVVQNVLLKKRKEQILKEAENEGEAIKKDKIIQAKEKFLQLKENHDKVIRDRERKLQSSEDRTKAKDKNLSKKIEEVSRKERRLE